MTPPSLVGPKKKLNSPGSVLTSYNHVIITDLASFKPVVLPSTDPGEFNFFFGPTREDGAKKCYLAPERFRDIGKGKVRRTNKRTNDRSNEGTNNQRMYTNDAKPP